jgi:hypothetical protein
VIKNFDELNKEMKQGYTPSLLKLNEKPVFGNFWIEKFVIGATWCWVIKFKETDPPTGSEMRGSR